MSLEEESYYSTEEHHRSPSKKKKKKKSKSVEEEELEHEEPEFFLEEPEPPEEVVVQKFSALKKKKKKSKDPPEEELEDEVILVPGSSRAYERSLKKVPKKAPAKKSAKSTNGVPASVPKAQTAVKKKSRGRNRLFPLLEPPPSRSRNPDEEETEEKLQWDGMQILAKMPPSDIEELLRRIALQCPLNDPLRIKGREGKIHWGDVEFGCYGPMQCKSVWSYLKNQARPFRIMSEIVEEIKFNFKADYRKFMQRVIETSPDFPKQPYAMGGFQFYCKELWDKYKELQIKMNKQVGNFLIFQTKCYNDWQQLPVETRAEFNRKGKLLFAEHKKKVKEYYAKFPGFAPRLEMLDKDGRVENGLSGPLRREAVRISNNLYKDAPTLPLTPLQLFVNSKLNRLDPNPTLDELPGLKAHYVEKYKPLPEDKKLKWIEKCVRKSERYLEELKEYKKTHPLYLLPKDFKIKMIMTREDINLWFKKNGEPPKPPITTFDVFLAEFRKTNTDTENEEVLRKSAIAKWEELGWYHKEMYKMKHKMEHVTFKKEFENYHATLPQLLRASAVDRLPKKFKKDFEEVDKEPLVLDDEEPIAIAEGIGETSDKKRKHPVSTAEESSQGEEQEGEGGSPKKKKKKKRKKYDEDKEDELDVISGSSNIPLYMMELNDDQKKLIDQKIKEEHDAIRASKKKQNAGPVPEGAEVEIDDAHTRKINPVSSYHPGKPITQSKKKRSS